MENKIKVYRKEKGLTIGELAQLSDLSKGYLCHLENGGRTNPTMKVCEKIAKALDKKVMEIFF